jgi:O-antigen ligase
MVLWTFVLGAYILISRVLKKQFDPAALQKIMVASGVITAVFGLYQFVANTYFGVSGTWTLLSPNYVKDILGFARVQSVGVEPLYYATFLFLPLCFLIVSLARSKQFRLDQSVCFVVLMLAFILTVSRGAYLGLLAAVCALLALLLLRHSLQRGAFYVIALTVVAALLSQGMLYGARFVKSSNGGGGTELSEQFIEHALGGEATRDSSLTPRLAALKDAWGLYRQHPVLGLGIGNYSTATSLQKTAENPFPIVNNQYLETFTELGPIGFLALLVLIFTILSKVIRAVFRPGEEKWFALALTGVIIGIGVQWNFFSTIYILLLWVVAGLVDAFPDQTKAAV